MTILKGRLWQFQCCGSRPSALAATAAAEVAAHWLSRLSVQFCHPGRIFADFYATVVMAAKAVGRWLALVSKELSTTILHLVL